MHRNLIGTVSHNTMRPEDLIPAFSEALESLDTCGSHITLIRKANAIEDFDSDDAQEIVSELFDALNEYAPAYCYFGAHPGNGSDYGFWPCEEWQEMAREDNALEVSDTSEVPQDYSGTVVHINDHGNATLYAADHGQLSEVWSIV